MLLEGLKKIDDNRISQWPRYFRVTAFYHYTNKLALKKTQPTDSCKRVIKVTKQKNELTLLKKSELLNFEKKDTL